MKKSDIDLSNKVFGKLKVTLFVKKVNGHTYWSCLCECGANKVVQGNSLLRGATTSCGCYGKSLIKARTLTHGMAKTSEYRIWKAVLGRCRNTNNVDYHLYGGRGIAVSEDWLKFKNFYRDMGKRPEDCSIDRIDPNLGYCKENCRWATVEVQANNKRTTIFVNHNGERKALARACREVGVPYLKVYHKLKTGSAFENILKSYVQATVVQRVEQRSATPQEEFRN